MRNIVSTCVILCSLYFISCDKNIDPLPEDVKQTNGKDSTVAPVNPITVNLHSQDTITYDWDNLSISRHGMTDIITRNSNNEIVQLKTITDPSVAAHIIRFTYVSDKILLDTRYNDEYTLDDAKKIIIHTNRETQNGINFVHTNRYYYDEMGYLKKIELYLNSDKTSPSLVSKIEYEVVNGNYTKYTVKHSNDKISRQYFFKYDEHYSLKSAFSFHVPILSNNTYDNCDKYLNYGNTSKNLMSSIDYSILMVNGIDMEKGSFSIKNNLKNNKTLENINLNGNLAFGMPYDNLSPLPKSIKFGSN